MSSPDDSGLSLEDSDEDFAWGSAQLSVGDSSSPMPDREAVPGELERSVQQTQDVSNTSIPAPSSGKERFSCELTPPPRLEQLGEDLSTCRLIWGLTNNVDYTFCKHRLYHDYLPCLLRGHC